MSTRILLVDDNEDLLKITELILKSQGHEITIATTFDDAEQQISLQHPQLMLLDVHVNDEDGLLFCKKLKQDPLTANLRIILMSGDDYAIEERNGADDFLSKPFDFNTLIEKVAQQLAGAEQTATNTLT